ncbi:hypothetical protein BC940DRAFT_250624 [Gongronella butleri]|nr:hypothetical protein BC940DRAFT_250624 [Gongronella butleri]
MLHTTRYPSPPQSHHDVNRRSSGSSLRSAPRQQQQQQQWQQQQQQQQQQPRSTLTTIRRRPSMAMNLQVHATHDYLPSNSEKRAPSLFFRKGTVIEILAKSPSGWWQGQYDQLRGWFPSQFVADTPVATSVRSKAINKDDDVAAQHELDAWRAALMEQKKHTTRMLSAKRQPMVSPAHHDKGSSLKQFASSSTMVRPAPSGQISTMRQGAGSRQGHRATITPAAPTRQNQPHSTTHTISSLRRSRVPCTQPSTPQSGQKAPTRPVSLFSAAPSQSMVTSTAPSRPVSVIGMPSRTNTTRRVSPTGSAVRQSPPPKQQQQQLQKTRSGSDGHWLEIKEQVSKNMFDLVDACLLPDVPPSTNHLGMRIHQTTTSIRSLLAAVPAPTQPIDQEMVAEQRTTILKLLSKVVHKGSELQLTGSLDDVAGFRETVNQLWVEVVAFEEIIRSTTVKQTRRPSASSISPPPPPYVPHHHAQKEPMTSPVSRDPAIMTPRSSTCQFDQIVTALFNHQTEIIDLMQTHFPDASIPSIKTPEALAIRQAKNAVFDTLTRLIDVVREQKQQDGRSTSPIPNHPPQQPQQQQQEPITPATTPDVEPLSPLSPKPKSNELVPVCAPAIVPEDADPSPEDDVDKREQQVLTKSGTMTPTSPPMTAMSPTFMPPPPVPVATCSPPPQPRPFASQLLKKQSAPNLTHPHRQRRISNQPPPLPPPSTHTPPPPPPGPAHQDGPISPTAGVFSSTHHDMEPVNKDSSISLASQISPCPSITTTTTTTTSSSTIRPCASHDALPRPLSSSTSSLIKRSSEFFRRSHHQQTAQVSNGFLDPATATASTISNVSSITLASSESATSTLQPCASISTSSSHRRLPRVTTLSNLAMRYLSSSSSSTAAAKHASQPLPPPSLSTVLPTTSTSTTNMSSICTSPTPSQPRPSLGSPPPQPTPSSSIMSYLRSSVSQEPAAVGKLSTSQSLRNIGVASLRNISRKPRRLSNQVRKGSDGNQTMPMPVPSRTIATPAAAATHDSPPLRLRLSISSSLRLRRSTDNDLAGRTSQDTEKSDGKKDTQDEQVEEEETQPWYLKQRLNASEMIYNADGHLVGASLKVLIDMLTSHEDCPDALFIRSFFYNFRLFMEPVQLANMLMDRFNLSPPVHPDTQEPLTTEEEELWQNDVRDPVRLRVYNVIKSWFEAYFDDVQDKDAARLLLPFAKSDMDVAMPMPAKKMTELIELKMMTLTTSELDIQKALYPSVDPVPENQVTLSPAMLAAPCPSSTMSTPIRNVFRRARLSHGHGPTPMPTITTTALSTRLSTIAVYRMDPQEIANQLTLMESQLFCQIPPSELMATHKKKSAPPAVHVKAMVHRSTVLVYWISNTILVEMDTKVRVLVIKFWIKVADACLQLNNFNTLMTIRCALNSAGIARLKRTWDAVLRSTKYKTTYHTIDTIADSERNFAAYRKCLKQATPPGLPFLGIFLSDMVFVDEGNADHRTSTGSSHGDLSLINFDKYMRMTQMLDQTITRFQQVTYYKLKEIKEIQRYLLECIESVNDSNEEQIYSKSLEIEPRVVYDAQ